MAVDVFLKIEGVEGESSDPHHKGEIEVSSYSWGVVNASGSLPLFQGLHVVSHLQKSSPGLFLSCATGVHYPKAILSVRKAGTSIDFFTLTLSEVSVSSFEQDASVASEDDAPLERISLAFRKVEVVHTVVSDHQIGETHEVIFELPG